MKITRHETKRCNTVGELVDYLLKFPGDMALMTASGDDIRATRLSKLQSGAIELTTWKSEPSPLGEKL